MTSSNPWESLVADTAAAWHGIDLDQPHAAAVSQAYPRWQEVVSASAAQLPMDSVPADADALLVEAARCAPMRLQPAADRAGAAAHPLDLELTAVAALLRRREIGARELAQAALQRLRALHDKTNACVSIDEEAALARASGCDAALQRGESFGPLHGVPLAHKDLLYRQGVAVGCGLRPRAQPPYAFAGTASVLELLAGAGSVNLGRLHMTEFAFDPSGANEELGPCRNPWSLDHVPGGSSSGSAVAVAGRAVYAALGTDTGGSIRIPASLCGITGLKPTRGVVDVRGAMPLSHSNDHIGPLARSAADCALMMQVIATAGTTPAPLRTALREAFAQVAQGGVANLKGLRIGVPERLFREGVDAQVAALLDDSLATLKALGAVVKPVPDFDWSALNVAGAVLTRVEAAARLPRLRSLGDIQPALLARFEEGLAIPGSVYVQILNERAAHLRAFLDTVMAEVDVLHAPVCRVPTPTIADIDGGGAVAAAARMELTVLNRPFNFLGVPALSLPCGFTVGADGRKLPVGFQLIGGPYADANLLAIGAAWQAHTDWHRQSPG